MSFQGTAVVREASPVRGRSARIGLWALQIALAAVFLMAGGSKLAGAPQMVALFEAIGAGQWFRYLTGSIEVTSAVALLVPTFAPFGAVALVATMAGAILTHLIIGGSPAMALALLVVSAFVAWARRDQLRTALGR